MNEEIEQLKLQLTGAHNANITLTKQLNEMSLIIDYLETRQDILVLNIAELENMLIVED